MHSQRDSTVDLNEPTAEESQLMVEVERELAELRVQTATDLARHDATSAQSQAERAVKNAIGLLQAHLGFGAAAAFLAPYALSRPIHAGGTVALIVFATLFVITVTNATWTIRSRVGRRASADSSGWLGVTAIPAAQRREHYFGRADRPLETYAAEAADVGTIALHKHFRNRITALGVVATQVAGVLTVALLQIAA